MSRNSGIPRQTNVSVLPGLHQVVGEGEVKSIILIRKLELPINSYHDDRFDLAKGLIRWRNYTALEKTQKNILKG